MAVETVPMDDKELFSAATAPDEAPAVTTEAPAEAEPEITGQPRDEQGRFAPKTAEAPQADAAPTQQQPEAGSTEPKDESGNVPSWRLREIREERDALARRAQEFEQQSTTYQQRMAEMERRMAELQRPKQEPVDFFADPNAAFKQQMSPVEERISQLEHNFRMSMSRTMAVLAHGKEAVAEMESVVAEAMRANDPEMRVLGTQIANSPDPVGTAMQWHANRKVMKETGGDIGKFREKILADAMKDPAFQAKVIEAARGSANTGAPTIKLPPSLNKTAGSGVTAADLASEDMSDRALFQYAAKSR